MKRTLPGFLASAAFALSLCSVLPARSDDAAKTHGPIAWTESLAGAMKTAARDRKVVMVDFWAEWCGPCKMMLATTYKDKAVVAKSKQFVPVLINVDKQAAIAQKYGIQAIPTIIFLDSKGNILSRSMGAVPASTFLRMMDDAKKKLKS
jgi:thioredoxin 1